MSDRSYPWFGFNLWPELLLFTNQWQCRQAFWRAGAWSGHLVCMMLLGAAMAFGPFLFESGYIWVPYCLLIFAIAMVVTWMFRGRMRRMLREDLVRCGIPVCVACGYDLRGQVEARCPECGAACDPHLLSRRAGTHTDR